MLSGVADWDKTLSGGEKYERRIFEPTGSGGEAGEEAAAGGQLQISAGECGNGFGGEEEEVMLYG